MDARRIFSQPKQSRGTRGTGRKVQVREFGDRMANRLIGDTLGSIAAVNMCDADTRNRSSTGGGKRFDSIAEYEHNIGVALATEFRHTTDTSTEGECICEATGFTFALHLEAPHSNTLYVRPRIDLADCVRGGAV
jgi:hypothetical protein